MRRLSGFTLIELMIVLVILGILIAVGFPSYQASVLKTKRADCQGVMLSYANALERRFTVDKTYDGGDIEAFSCPSNGKNTTYDLNLTTTATTFQITATPTGAQTKDKCNVLTLNQAGRKTSGNASSTDDAGKCW